jgi:alpha-D-ribose 1-methylphosphonate 5-triphosphate synthase subunit PhnG
MLDAAPADPPPDVPGDAPQDARRRWMSVLARAASNELESCLAGLAEQGGGIPTYQRLRGPESGLVMVRGRAGGGGAKFNLGEMTVTRCTVRTEAGQVGHAYVAGRDVRRAELAAVFDALLQDPARRDALRNGVVAKLAAEQAARRGEVARKAAATKVQFFAMRNMRTS